MALAPHGETHRPIKLEGGSTRTTHSPAAVLVWVLALLFGAICALVTVWVAPAAGASPTDAYDYDARPSLAARTSDVPSALASGLAAGRAPVDHAYDDAAQHARTSASWVAGFLAPQTSLDDCEPGRVAVDANALIQAIDFGNPAVDVALAGRRPVAPPRAAQEYLVKGSQAALTGWLSARGGGLGSPADPARARALQAEAQSLGRTLWSCPVLMDTGFR